MTLRQKQARFAHMVAMLILHAEHLGFEVTLAEAFRVGDPRLHGKRLAIDINLFRDGKYLTRTDDHRPLGDYWKLIGGSWGGDFNDGNHYSLEHGGQR